MDTDTLSKKVLKPDFRDTEPADTLTDAEIECMVSEIHELNSQAHEYLRITPQSLNIIVGIIAADIAAFAVQTPGIDTFWLHNIASLFSPLAVSVILTYHFNVTTDAAVLAEQRDRLSYRVNHKFGRPIFVGRIAADLLRGSAGTWTAGIPIGILVFSMIAGGIWNAVTSGVWWLMILQITVSLVAIGSIVITFLQIPKKRALMNEALDEVFGKEDRPKSAAYSKDSLRKRLTTR